MEDEKLISLVKSFKLLYDKKSPNFKNREKKKIAWEQISKTLCASVEICVKRWNVLRERYSREARRHALFGSFTEENNTWHLYDAMNFLRPHVKPRRSRGCSKILETKQDDCIKGSFEMVDFATPWSMTSHDEPEPPLPPSDDLWKGFTTPSPTSFNAPNMSSKRKRKGEFRIDEAFLEAVACFKKLCEKQEPIKNPAVVAFGHMITATIAEMSPKKQGKAMKELTALVIAIKEEPE